MDRCTCPEDWQGMDHTAGCQSRSQCPDCGATLPTHEPGCHDGPKSGLVFRLRQESENAMRVHLSLGMYRLCGEAADEIERRRAALLRIAQGGNTVTLVWPHSKPIDREVMCEIARAALGNPQQKVDSK